MSRLPTNVVSRQAMIASAVFLVGLGLTSTAEATRRFDPQSLTRSSPSVINGDADAASIYREVGPLDVGPQVDVAGSEFGAVSSGDNTLDFSAGETDIANTHRVFFSVSAGSLGASGAVLAEQALNQGAADVFVSSTALSPLAAIGGTPSTASGNSLFLNQTDYNFLPALAAGSNNVAVQDDSDGFELSQFKNSGVTRVLPVYFNLDASSPSLADLSLSAVTSWIFYTPNSQSTVDSVFAQPGTLGLVNADVIDGLAVYDGGTLGLAETGEYVVFSLQNGSPSLGTTLSGADVFVSALDGSFFKWIDHSQLGLLSTDEIDALDVAIPEPTSLGVVALGALALVRRRRA